MTSFISIRSKKLVPPLIVYGMFDSRNASSIKRLCVFALIRTPNSSYFRWSSIAIPKIDSAMKLASSVSFCGIKISIGFPPPFPLHSFLSFLFVLCEMTPFAASSIVSVDR